MIRTNGYSVNSVNGALTPLAGSPFASTSGASSLFFTTGGKFAFSAGSFYGSTQVESFSVNATTGALTSLGTQPSGNPPCGASNLTPNNKFWYVPNYQNPGTIYGFNVNTSTGALTPITGSPFSGHELNCGAFVHPSGKFLYVVNWAPSNAPVTISAYSINQTSGALSEIAGSPFAGAGQDFDNYFLTDPTGKFLYVAVGPPDTGNGDQGKTLLAYSVNLTTGALTPVPGSPYSVGTYAGALTMDPTGKLLYVGNIASSGDVPAISTFSVNSSTGALTQIGTEGVRGDSAFTVSLVTGTAPVTYTPQFAYVTNQTDKTISEYTINDTTGALTAVAGSPLVDKNGPQVVAVSPNNKFVYTGNSNGSISEYKVSATTGALTKVIGSPLTGLGNPISLVVDPTSSFLLVADQANKSLSSYTINPTTGALTFLSTATLGAAPTALALNPLGTQAFVSDGTVLSYFPISPTGSIGSSTIVAAGYPATGSFVDPSSQYLFQADSQDVGVVVYTLYTGGLVPGFTSNSTGNGPDAVLSEPSGRFVYVANGTDSTISAFSLNNSTGVLTTIAGTFTTGSGPDSLSASNDGKYLYSANKSSGTISIFTINSDGTLTSADTANTGTSPTSVVTTGTYR